MGSALALVSPNRKLRYSYSETVKLLPASTYKLIDRDQKTHNDTTSKLYNWFFEQAGFHLDVSTERVLRSIFSRTYRYYKQAELISVRQIQEGVWKENSELPVCCPAISDVRSVRKALSVLERIGYITRTLITINNVKTFSLVQLHPERILKDIHTKADETMLRARRKDKELQVDDLIDDENTLKPSKLRMVHKCTIRMVHKCTNESINKDERINSTGCSRVRNGKRFVSSQKADNEIDFKSNDPSTAFEKEVPVYRSAEAAIADAVARVTKKREDKVRQGVDNKVFITLREFNATWQSVMIDKFGTCTVAGLTHKEYGILRRVAKTHTLSCSWKEFLEWVVSNWSRLNEESKEYLEYRKRKHGDWSLKEEDRIFLGTSAPDTYMFVKNFGKLFKRFVQVGLVGAKLTKAETAEVITLRKELEAERRKASMNKQLLDRVLVFRGQSSAATVPKKKTVKIADPEKDTFFNDFDTSLPERL